MTLSKSQIIILGTVLLVVFGAILLFSCTIPGIQSCDKPAVKITGNLSFWGVGNNEDAYQTSIAVWNSMYPGVKVEYKNFSTNEEYYAALLDALAAGKGPDVFMIQNGALQKYENKISPLTALQFPITKLRALFPQVVENNFVSQGLVYALPLSLDTLALFYNRDHIDQAAVLVPSDWNTFTDIATKLTIRDEEGRITRAGVAFGGSENINRAGDILQNLMMQYGVQMISSDNTYATFGSKKGEDALRFYTQFANPANTNTVWSELLQNAHTLFTQEKVSMIIDYASAISEIRAQNTFLNFAIAPFPQIKDTTKPVTFGKYFGYTVAKQSKNKNLAWEFVTVMTTNAASVKGYSDATHTAPALRTLITETLKSRELGVFARQALIARSWESQDPENVSQILSTAIGKVLREERTIHSALLGAATQVTKIISNTSQ